MTTLETVRPNGKVYRRRKPLQARSCCWNEWSVVVLVYGTHDRELARDLAQTEWDREQIDGEMPEPVAIWIKEVPWDALGYGYDRTILEVKGDVRGSWPCLRYGGEW